MRWLIAIGLCIGTGSSVGQALNHTWSSLGDGYQVAMAVRSNAPKVAVTTTPTIVFIPGILGSKLKWDKYVYGVGKIDAARLVYNKNNPPKAETLDSFEIWPSTAARILRAISRNDVYGESLERLKVENYGKLVEEFAYDWRADIDDSAKALQTWLSRPELKNQSVVFIAHSMGGLVLWRWLQAFPPASRPVQVHTAVFAGSPLQGSCEAARMLLTNYGPPADGSSLEHIGTYYLFKDAHPALLTFPSVFQVLPSFDPDHPCLWDVRNGQEAAANHHEQGFWFGSGRPQSSGMKANDQKMLKEYAGIVGLSASDYEARVRDAIVAGARFRKDLRTNVLDAENVVYMYSALSKMPRSHRIQPRSGGGWFDVLADDKLDTDGDGRVLVASAQNRGVGIAPKTQRIRLQQTHGLLISDKSLLSYVRDNIIRPGQLLALADTVDDESVRTEFLRRGLVFDSAVATLDRDPAIVEAQVKIATYNAEAVAPGARAKGNVLRALGANEELRVSDPKLAAALLESSIVLTEDDPDFASFKSIISLRVQLDQRRELFTTAKKISPAGEAYSAAETSPWRELVRYGIADRNLTYAKIVD